MPYLRHFGAFVPKIYDFERRIGVNNMRKLLYYKNFRIGVFFLKKRLIVPNIVPKVSSVLRDLKECDGTHSERSARRVPTLRNQRKHRTN